MGKTRGEGPHPGQKAIGVVKEDGLTSGRTEGTRSQGNKTHPQCQQPSS